MTNRKHFPKVDFDQKKAIGEDSGAGTTNPQTQVVVFPRENNATAARSFDFGPWYGRGIDAIVSACQVQVQRFLTTHEGNLAVASVVVCCQTGLSPFLTYLTLVRANLRRDLKPSDIDRDIIDGFLAFLDDGTRVTSSQRSCFKAAKTVLLALCKRGVIPWKQSGDDATFPTNPFPRHAKHSKGARPLSREQRRAFTAAVKTAVMPLLTQTLEPTSELLAYALLVVALHTGRNTTPLLELNTECLRPHPKEHLQLLIVYKRRAHRYSATPVRAPRQLVESTAPVFPTVGRLIQRVIEITQPLRDEAPAHLRDRLWVYRTTRGADRGSVSALTPQRLGEAAALLAERFDLRDAHGQRLRVTVSMLRQTFVNRINEILDDDLTATAAAAGNSVAVTGVNYLKPGEAAEKNWRFMGRALTNELLTSTLGATEKTPVGGCSDVAFGQFAPKVAGAYCMSFLDCLRCRNYVVTGDDLHRLFSFYWRVYRERSRINVVRWRRRYAHIIRLIDRDVIAAGLARRIFKPMQIDQARERARLDPHPYWRDLESFEVFE